ncbi:MAG: class I SAM-dependent methyltransferase [Bacteroidetes bacterium]|nr:class I SAM-dependent methyltransferase [Bacteroidota bacterium]
MGIQTAERSSAEDASENPIYQRHMAAYKAAVPWMKGSVLEVGCGEGYGMKLLAKHCQQYLGIDKFPVPNLHVPPNARTLQMTVPPLGGINSNQFDAVVTFQVIEHIEDDLEFLREIHRVLHPGGVLILTTPNRLMSLTRNPWHVREYDPEAMRQILESVFGQVDLRGVFGNEKVMDYYQKNKESVRKFTRWDFLNLQYRLPRRWLQVPYDLANRLNRRSLEQKNDRLVSQIGSNDYPIRPLSPHALDYFAVCTK